MKRHPFQCHQRYIFPPVNIMEEKNIRSLLLGSDTVQSAMNIDNPPELVLSYSRAMVTPLLFCPDLHTVVHVGLGGGSILRFLAAYFPDMRHIAVEINPHVISVAKMLFKLPPEGENLEIICVDAAQWMPVNRHNCDWILLDGFDGEQIVNDLVSESFFEYCARALTDNGVISVNLWSADVRYKQFVGRLRRHFAYVLEIPAATHGNVAVCAFKRLPVEIDTVKARAHALSEHTQMNFDALWQEASRALSQQKS